MPFNQGSDGAGNVGGAGNPECEDSEDYATSYLWKRVLRRDMLLSIFAALYFPSGRGENQAYS